MLEHVSTATIVEHPLPSLRGPASGFPHTAPAVLPTTSSPGPQVSAAATPDVLLRWNLEEWRSKTDLTHPVSTPPEWVPVLHQLNELVQPASTCPTWWTSAKSFAEAAKVPTDAAPGRAGEPTTFYFLLSLSGWGNFQSQGQDPQRLGPGQAVFAIDPSQHRVFVPDESPGWNFAWIGINHPYLRDRIAKQVAATGHLIDVRPDGELMTRVFRLLRGTIKREFRDHLEAELGLFEFVVTYERQAQQVHDGSGEHQRLVDEVRKHIIARLPEAIAVGALAAEFGMSRSHFSHLFRERTGLTPAHFATEVRIQEAIRMLLDSRVPLQTIAEACGFSSASHFCKVFRRHRHLSPSAFRQIRR